MVKNLKLVNLIIVLLSEWVASSRIMGFYFCGRREKNKRTKKKFEKEGKLQ